MFRFLVTQRTKDGQKALPEHFSPRRRQLYVFQLVQEIVCLEQNEKIFTAISLSTQKFSFA